MYTAFPCSDYYDPSAPSWPHGPATGFPVVHAGGVNARDSQDGSHVRSCPFDEGGVQLYPSGIATATPQTFTVASTVQLDNRPSSSRDDNIVAVRAADPARVRQV